MEAIINDIESSRNQAFDIVVPFPDLEQQQQQQPLTDSSAATDSSSACSTTTNMQSSLSSTTTAAKAREHSHDGLRPSLSSCKEDDSKPSSKRLSFQDEMHSIDIEAVADPASEIKRILDGLVAELKEEVLRQKESDSASPDKAEGKSKSNKREECSPDPLEQGCAKRSRLNNDEDALKSPPNQNVSEHNHQQDALNENEHQDSSSNPNSTNEPIETIMTWMDTFQSSEHIQLSCLQSLSSLLENNILRYHAQTSGLASIVFYNMAAFPKNFLLQLTAFHTLVVLLRPLGALEGTIVKGGGGNDVRSVVGERGKGRVNINHIKKKTVDVNNADSSNTLLIWEENGVRVMLDTLRLYSNDKYLQAMGCWAMVNAALYPSLKKSLLKLGGVYVVTNAMMLHPNAEAVQFRALFALINFVIPDGGADATPINTHVYQIARLTILAMKNFQTNKSILNRGCLVLRNLSLTPSHATILARTPGCVNMLMHCRQVCPRDTLVQRSARTIMILIQRITDRQTIWSGVGSSTVSSVARSSTSVPNTAAPKESGREQARSSSSL